MIPESRRMIITLGMSGALVLGGCATVPKDAGFDDVRQAVAQRTGKRVRWNRDSAADRQVADAVHRILQNELTLDAAVQVALLNNQNLQATYEELGIAQADLVQAGLLSNPTLSAEVRFPKYHALPFEVDVMQSFLDLLLMPVRKRAAGAAFEAAKLRVTYEVLNTVAEVKSAFYRAQGAQQLVEMRQSVADATDASLEAARKLHEAGNITALSAASERALHEQAKLDLEQAQADALDAREELNALMGVWGQETHWTMAGRLPELPSREIDVLELESLAVEHRCDLGAARQEVDVAAENLGLTRYSILGPDLTVGGHLEKDTDGALTVGPAVSVPIPLFNQGQPAVAAGEARLRQSRRRYLALGVQIRADVRRLSNRMSARRRRAQEYSSVVLPLRREIVRQTQLQYNAMSVGVFQLLQAKQAEIEAGREYVLALQDYWVSRAELERSVGGALPERESATTKPVTKESHQHPHGE